MDLQVTPIPEPERDRPWLRRELTRVFVAPTLFGWRAFDAFYFVYHGRRYYSNITRTVDEAKQSLEPFDYGFLLTADDHYVLKRPDKRGAPIYSVGYLTVRSLMRLDEIDYELFRKYR